MTLQSPQARPFCAWVIAREYYDGAMAGIGLRERDQTSIFFRAIAWDREQWDRVFAITPISGALAEQLRSTLVDKEAPKQPFWFPGEATNTREVTSAWDALFADACTSVEWTLVGCHDLLDPVEDTTLPRELTDAVTKLVKDGTVRDLDAAQMVSALIEELRGRTK